jgi:GST-like protein
MPGRLLPSTIAERVRALERYFYFVPDVIAPNNAGAYLKRSGAGDAASLFLLAVDAIVQAERFVTETEFMGGLAFSLADIAAYTVINALHDDVAWNHMPALSRWYRTIGRRPGIQRGMSAFDAA